MTNVSRHSPKDYAAVSVATRACDGGAAKPPGELWTVEDLYDAFTA